MTTIGVSVAIAPTLPSYCANSVITPRFPAGLTIFDVDGQFQDIPHPV